MFHFNKACASPSQSGGTFYPTADRGNTEPVRHDGVARPSESYLTSGSRSGVSNNRRRLVNSVARVLMITLALCAAPRLARTQVLYGSVTGTVTDQKGSAVPGAKVELVNVGTG